MSLMLNCKRGALILALLVLSGCSTAPTVSITFGGDILLAREGKALFADVHPWSSINAAIEQQQKGASQVYFFANLESPVADSSQTQKPTTAQGYDLCANSDQLSVLREGRVSLVNLANNHKDDCLAGSESTTKTIVERAGFQTVGPDLTPAYLETQAGKIAVLAAEDVTHPLDMPAFLAAIRAVRPQCDILIVSLHWGNEYQSGASPRQRQLAQKLADAGVDVLWGQHPHVLQPAAWVNSAEGKHRMLVMYSLGNLLADQWMNEAVQQSALVTLQIREKKIVGFSVLPIQMERTSRQLVMLSQAGIGQIEAELGVKGLTGLGVIQSAPGN